MTQQQTYIHGHHASVLKTHNQRTAQNSCHFLLSSAHLKNLSSKTPAFTLLDAGCGPGSITISLAKLFPKAQITALDFSNTALEFAREAAAKEKVTNVTFVQGDVYRLPFETDAFDIVHAQQLLCHLADPVAAINEMKRVVKAAGGLIALRETDVPGVFFYPELVLLKRMFSLVTEQMESAETAEDARAGRKLKSWILQSKGAKKDDLTMSAGTWSYSSESERHAFAEAWMERVTSSDFALKTLESGRASREELQQIQQAWKEWSEDEDGFLCIPHGEALISC
jgi:ubiquinone/menaquinone biosynthesis C-methylase UbiE